MKKATSVLPKGYVQYLSIDLQKDKKLALLVNGMAILIGAIMAVPMNFAVPIETLFDMEKGLDDYILRFGVLLVGMLAYIILHEAVHGVVMKLCGAENVKYGFTGLYAYAGSGDYFPKRAYILIALAPVILWGGVLLALSLLVPVSWFWAVYIIQIMNISGAAGDIYVTVKFIRMPKNILVQDSGMAMAVYTEK